LQDYANMFISLIVKGIFSIAFAYLFLQLAKKTEKITMQTFLEGLNFWAKGILITLWTFLWTFLWSFLFIIPGIIKTIAYSQMNFIIAENPDIDVQKAMKMSISMTRGYKGELFILALSFIGWLLLNVLTFGILMLWLRPYMNMTLTNAYLYLKNKALDSGALPYEDFGMSNPSLLSQNNEE
ncbi:MAG TPA: DUF975 family protein, partial [Treponemataceae bacterium]|nr:DUF975 family protein [Treponemataceae bacterium]